MSTPTLKVTAPGIFTTVQDRGRYGYQRYGVPVSGAMDEFALRAANLLLDNDQGSAGLEMTALGPTIEFLADTWVAVTGADLSPTLDGRPLPRWSPARVQTGDVLSFGEMRDGLRAYLAVAGGLDVPVAMGSRSTYVKAAIGGLDGRPLQQGDVLSAFPGQAEYSPRRLPRGFDLPTYGDRHGVRVILGPQDAAFDPEAISIFLSSEYTVSLDSDRMGYRLEGPAIPHLAGPDIVSDGTPLGAVQIAGDGVPTILLADRGTTGGYAKIATIISADIGRLAQAVSGHTVAFEAVDVEAAHAALRDMEAALSAIGRSTPRIAVEVDGESYEVLGQDGRVVARRRLPEGEASSARHHARATAGGQTFEFDVVVREQE